ncbi:MAG: translation initiation factor IF-5A [bacterium]|nr:translation initiation factor IF-5A [bacterium]
MPGDFRPATAKELKEGSYVLIEGEPCKVLSISISTPGKHGAAKARIEAIGIFDNQRRSIVLPADSKVDIPIIERRRAQVIAVSPGTLQLMDMETFEIFELPRSQEDVGVGDIVEYLAWGEKKKFNRVLERKA